MKVLGRVAAIMAVAGISVGALNTVAVTGSGSAVGSSAVGSTAFGSTTGEFGSTTGVAVPPEGSTVFINGTVPPEPIRECTKDSIHFAN